MGVPITNNILGSIFVSRSHVNCPLGLLKGHRGHARIKKGALPWRTTHAGNIPNEVVCCGATSCQPVVVPGASPHSLLQEALRESFLSDNFALKRAGSSQKTMQTFFK